MYANAPSLSPSGGLPSLIRGELIGIIQAVNFPNAIPLASGCQILLTVVKVPADGSQVYIEKSNGSFAATITGTKYVVPEITGSSGTVTHIGNSNFTLSGTTADKRVSIKYITRV